MAHGSRVVPAAARPRSVADGGGAAPPVLSPKIRVYGTATTVLSLSAHPSSSHRPPPLYRPCVRGGGVGVLSW